MNSEKNEQSTSRRKKSWRESAAEEEIVRVPESTYGLCNKRQTEHDCGDEGGTSFSDEDRRMLAAMGPVIEGLADFFGPYGEVLLHSLEDLSHSIIQVANGHITGRRIGSPVTDLALQILHSTEHNAKVGYDVGGQDAESNETGDARIYSSATADGRPLRCMTSIIRNGGRPIGMLCVNYDLSAPVHEIVSRLSEGFSREREDSPEHYVMSAEDLVKRSLDTAIRNTAERRGVSPQAKNRIIVSELDQRGIFRVKGAVEMVSAELGVSRFTVYNYLREFKHDE